MTGYRVPKDLAQKAAALIVETEKPAPLSIVQEPPRLLLLDDTEIESLPDAQWIINPAIPANAFVAIIGKPKSLKTFFALYLAAHIALGLECHGMETLQTSVAYIYAEGVTGLRQRLKALKAHLGCDYLGIRFLTHRLSINKPLQVDELLAAFGEDAPGIIFIDTLARNIEGDENSPVDMGAFIRGCDSLREATGATVVVIHHTGWSADDRSRGHSSLLGAVDTQLLVSRDASRVTVECQWQKDAPEFGTLALEVLPIAGSIVLNPSGLTSGKLEGQRRELMEVVHRQSTESGMTHSAWMNATGLGKSSFNKARKWLLDRAYVKQERSRYHATDAGIAALSTTSTAGTLGE
jgi:hypothetical protein